jgi:undecaprenyl diphosphate synthase
MVEDLNIPAHIAIIMDGNGRWAKERGQERLFGHNAGRDSVRVCTKYAAELGVKYLSLFAFSEENWGRPGEEVSGLMYLMAKALVDEKELFIENDIRFKVIGDRSRLSDELGSQILSLEELTMRNSRMTLIVFLSYSGKWDIIEAAQLYANQCVSMTVNGEALEPLTKEKFDKLLSTVSIPDPDLLIRTSGEQRISNFMLWQCAYSEFYFTTTLWPDFRKEDLLTAIKNYSTRKRRFGKTDDQIIK